MFHPFEGDLSELKDAEVEQRLFELNKKYYAAARLGNPDLLTQVGTFVTIYREELSRRYMLKSKGQMDGDLDQLINVD
jgi:hypothetical protein